MVRRSSLIIAASLAVLSTYAPGSLCFAAAAPAAQPAEDRFERPRFMKKEIHRFVFANTTTHRPSTTSDDHVTTPISIPDLTTVPPDVNLAAELSSNSLASAEASWSAAHPGIPFGDVLPDSTTSAVGAGGATTAATTAAAGAATTLAPAAASTQPPPAGQSGSQGASSSGPGAQESNNGGNPPSSTGTPLQSGQGGTTQSQPGGGVVTPPSVPVSISVTLPDGSVSVVVSVPSVPAGSSIPGGGAPSLSVPIVSDGSQTEVIPGPTGQTTGGQQGGGQETTGTPIGGIIPPASIPGDSDSSQTMIIPSVTPPLNGASQTAEPVSNTGAGVAGVTPGSTPSSNSQVIPPVVLPSNSLIAALSSALAISSPPNAQSVVNSLGQTVASIASPIIIGSSTDSAGIVHQITASTPAESSAGVLPILGGSTTDSAGNPIPILTGVPSASGGVKQVLPPGVVSTNAQGLPITGSEPALSGSLPAASLPAVVASESLPLVTGSAPVIAGSTTNSNGQLVPITGTPPPSESTGVPPPVVGSMTNSIGQVVPVTSAPLAGSTTNAEGQVVPISSVPVGSTTNAEGQVVPVSSANALSNDRFNQFAVQHPSQTSAGLGPSASVVAGQSQIAPLSGVSASEPANTAVPAGQTLSPPPGASTAGPEGPASSASAAVPLPIATHPQSYNTDQNAPITQLPTASDSMTAQPVASSIEVASSSAPPTGVMTGTMETGLPSGVPLVLYPPTGPVNRPANTELIQIGFLYPLNYDFVWQHEESQRQIFHYLPIGIAYGLSIDLSNVTMQTLRAWDTTEDLHYITTLALAWIPSTLVDSLGLILHTQAEKFYHNPDPAVRTLLSMINPALPIRADNATDGGPENGVGASPSGTATANGGTIANGINNSSPVKASSVGIGVGVVCGAAAYGAAMFFVARRYKKRRQSHLRSPSMYSSPVMSQHGADPAAAAALMSGGMGERSISPYYDNDRGPSRGSGRSGSSAGRQQISAPVMAENSLGWN